MKPIKAYNHCLVFISVLLFFSEFALYTYEKEVSPISLKSWAFIMLGGALLLLALEAKKIKPILNRPIFHWLGAFLIFTLIWGLKAVAIDGTYGEYAVEQVNRNILAVIYIFSFAIILYRESAFLLAQKLTVWVLLLSVIINIYDFIGLDQTQFSAIYGRAGGLYTDPNICATALTMGYILTISIIRPNWRFIYSMWLFLGILLTQSRGGILVFSLVLFLFYLKGRFSKKSVLVFGSVFLLCVSAIGLKLFNDNKADFFSKLQAFDTMFERYEQLVNPQVKHVKEDSRMRILTIYLTLWLKNPLLGNGIGAANYYKKSEFVKGVNHKISSHNQLLNMMVDFGIIGFILFFSFLYALLIYNNTFFYTVESNVFLIAFVLFAMVSHTLLRDFYAFFVYAFIARLVQYEYHKGEDKFYLNHNTN